MKNILIFNDISGLGNCSMSANLPIFTKLGHYCMPIITAAYSCQTGFVRFTCQKNGNLPQCVKDVLSNRKPDAVYVGFCADLSLLSQVKESLSYTDDAFLFVDPILGDNGALYSVFDQAYVSQMKSLVQTAGCVSPNLTEACLLTDVSFEEVVAHSAEADYFAYCGKVFENFLQKTGAKSAVITGIEHGDVIGNMVLEKDSPPGFIINDRVHISYSGTGDAFSSVLLGKLLSGCRLPEAARAAADFVCKASVVTECGDRRFGVEFSRVLDCL